MRKSARGIKPSSKLLESKGIEVDGYTPTAETDLQKARARESDDTVVVAPAVPVSSGAAPRPDDASPADAVPAAEPPGRRLVASSSSSSVSSSSSASSSTRAAPSIAATVGTKTEAPQEAEDGAGGSAEPLSSKGMFAKLTAGPVIPAADARLPASSSSSSGGGGGGGGGGPKYNKRVQRTVLEDPLAKRCRLLEIQRNHFKRMLDRVLKIDRYGFILGKDYSGLPTPRGMTTLTQVMRKAEKGNYYMPHAMREHDWANSRKIVEMLRSRQTYEEVKLLEKSDFLDINWDAIEADLRNIWEYVYKHETVNDDPRSFYNCAKRLEEFVADNFASTRTKNKEELHKVLDEEKLERLTFENREPAMSNWRKKPQERREYTQVGHYKVVEGITEEEHAELEALLDASGSENRWLLPEDGDAESALNARGAVKKKRRRADGAAAPVRVDFAGNDLPFVSWRLKELGKDLLEVDSWGIDPFTRRNLSIALESVEDAHLRMTQPQMNWFIEGLLLRELNRQGSDVGWDLNHALHSLRKRALSGATASVDFFVKRETADDAIVTTTAPAPAEEGIDKVKQANVEAKDQDEPSEAVSQDTIAPAAAADEITKPASPSAATPAKEEAANPVPAKDASESVPAGKEPSVPAEKEAGEPAEKETSELAEKEASVLVEKDAEEPAEKDAGEPAKEVTDSVSTKGEVSEPAKNEVSEPAKNEVSEPAKNEASELAREEAGESAKEEVSEPAKQEPSGPASNKEANEPASKKEASEPAKTEANETAKEDASETWSARPPTRRAAANAKKNLKMSKKDDDKEAAAAESGDGTKSAPAADKEPSENSKTAAKATLKRKAAKTAGKDNASSNGDADSLADVVEKINRVERKRKRTNLVEHENIIWSSRRTRRKPQFFEAVPKEPVPPRDDEPAAASNDDEDDPARPTASAKGRGTGKTAAASSRKRGRTPSASTTFRKSTRAKGAKGTTKAQRAASRASTKRKASGRRAGRASKAGTDSEADEGIEEEEVDAGNGTTENAVASGRDLVGKRVSVFRPVECAWFSGRITSFSASIKKEGKNHCVLFDNGIEEWVDILKDRCIVENVTTTTYDRNVTDDMVVAAVDVILRSIRNWGQHNFCVHPKGVGVVCLNREGISKGDILGSYHGELYPLWLWEQKEAREDALRKQTRAGKTTLPDFWNMRFEIPSSEPNGFTILYVDSKHFGTSMSRLSHSCRPNACVMMAVVDGKYNIAMRALRNIEPGEEVTIDYNCVTDSMDEFRAAICLCGSEGCRGSFLYITGAQQFMQVVERRHQPVHRAAMLFEASLQADGSPPPATGPTPASSSTQGASRATVTRKRRTTPKRAASSGTPPPREDLRGLDADSVARMQKYGLKLELLDRLPVWALRFVALALRFVEQEQLELPSRLFHEELARREKVASSGVNGVQAGHGAAGKQKAGAGASGATGSGPGASKKAPAKKAAAKKPPAPKKAPAAKKAPAPSKPTRKTARATRQRASSASSANGTGAAKGSSASSANASGAVSSAQAIKRDLDPESAREIWESVKREAKGIARQRVCNLIIALSKLRHRMDTRIRLGFEGALENVRPTMLSRSLGGDVGFGSERNGILTKSETWGAMSPSRGSERVPHHNQKVRDLVNETTAKLVERVWWVGDRCEARWCGDDAADYPGWYSGTILHVYPNPLSEAQGSAYEKKLVASSAAAANTTTAAAAAPEAPATSEANGESGAAASAVAPGTPAHSPTPSSRAAGGEAQSETPSVPDENGKPSKREGNLAGVGGPATGTSGDPASKAYHDAILHGPSVHILYDDGKVINRIPIGSDVLRRPQLAESEDYPLPHVALSTKSHQSPFRPLTDENVMDALWNDRANSVMQRVVRLLERNCVYHVNLWQPASDPRIKTRYWWNIKTRAIHKGKPPVADRAEKMTYVPRAMREIRELANYCVGTIEEARDGICRLRDLVLKIPGVAQSEDGQVWKDGKMEDAHQKLVDLLTFYSLTTNWFQVTEAPPVNFYGPGGSAAAAAAADDDDDPAASHPLHHESSVVAPLLGWLDQKEENMLVEQLMGTTVLPEVESAYAPTEAAKYGSHVRNRLMKQLADNKKRYQDWDKDTQRMFPPSARAAQDADMQADAWPPPLPPPRLFGSPVLDAALFDNRKFDGEASGFEGRLDDVYYKKQVLEDQDKPASAEGDDVFQRLLTVLKATRRSGSRLPGKEGQMFSPPPPPTVNQHVWIQCDDKECNKWRKLPAGYAASDFPENFTCSMLKRVDPHFASCSVPEEPSTGEASLKWGYGIGSVDDLQSGHRIDAYHRRSRKWFAVEIVDARADAVQVVFPRQAGRTEDWLPRHPGPGQFASVMPLYSFSARADDRAGQRVYRFVEKTKRELSKFGQKALIKDYQPLARSALEASGLSKTAMQTVLGVLADLVNQVSADGGEPLGRVEVKIRRKVLVDDGHLSPANAGAPGVLRRASSTQSTASAALTERSAALRDRNRRRTVQREAMFMFFKEMKRLYGGLISFEDISRQADALDDRQLAYLNPTSWSNNSYGTWVDAAFDEDIGVSMEQDPAERDEEHVVVGMQVVTPDGVGVVLRRTGIRTYCVAVQATKDMRVETAFGWGTVQDVRDNVPPVAKVALDMGATMYIPDLAVEVEYYLVIPVEALVHAKMANVPLEHLLKTKSQRSTKTGEKGSPTPSVADKREKLVESPFPPPAAPLRDAKPAVVKSEPMAGSVQVQAVSGKSSEPAPKPSEVGAKMSNADAAASEDGAAATEMTGMERASEANDAKGLTKTLEESKAPAETAHAPEKEAKMLAPEKEAKTQAPEKEAKTQAPEREDTTTSAEKEAPAESPAGQTDAAAGGAPATASATGPTPVAEKPAVHSFASAPPGGKENAVGKQPGTVANATSAPGAATKAAELAQIRAGAGTADATQTTPDKPVTSLEGATANTADDKLDAAAQAAGPVGPEAANDKAKVGASTEAAPLSAGAPTAWTTASTATPLYRNSKPS